MPNCFDEEHMFLLFVVKTKQIISRGIKENDILVDDYSVNIHSCTKSGGASVKVLNGINNTSGKWSNNGISVFDTAPIIANKL